MMGENLSNNQEISRDPVYPANFGFSFPTHNSVVQATAEPRVLEHRNAKKIIKAQAFGFNVLPVLQCASKLLVPIVIALNQE